MSNNTRGNQVGWFEIGVLTTSSLNANDFGPVVADFPGDKNFGTMWMGSTITSVINRYGAVSSDPNLANHGVTATYHVPETGHNVASPFWEFMNSSGPVYENDDLTSGQLFENPFYATGFPLTEAYWTEVRIGGQLRTVLVQVFERRVLTYSPENPPGWQVEAGNVGIHFFLWRYVMEPDGIN